MGFDGEYASYSPLRRILESKKVQSLQEKLLVNQTVSGIDFFDKYQQYIFNKELLPSDFTPNYIIAIDGSYHQVKINNGFPEAEIGYIAIAAGLILHNEVNQLSKQNFIDPKEFRDTEKASTIDTIIPGCNIIIQGEKSGKASMRKALFDELSATKVFDDGETLLDTYEYLLDLKLKSGFSKPAQSPIDGVVSHMMYQKGKYQCTQSGETLYSTDALRLHELFNDMGENGGLYGQVMGLLEALWLIHILRSFEQKGWLELLSKTVFVLDGPLACFSTWSWLHKSIIKEIERINIVQKQKNHPDLLIFSIEKSGAFCNHFEALDTENTGIQGKFKPQTGLLLNDAYIKQNIIFSDSAKPYGKETYFGRKFFYKTKNNYRLVINIAFLSSDDANTLTANINQYPRLNDLINLLDDLTSSRYNHSITPLVLAHSEAAIPLNLGRKIFEEIAREIKKK